MNTQDKSLKMAELMGVTICVGHTSAINDCNGLSIGKEWHPYDDWVEGRSQFAAILLKFPEVMLRFKWRYRPIVLDAESKARAKKIWNIQPTQANILDEILRMNGVNMDAN